MNQFYVPNTPFFISEVVSIEGQEAIHIGKVLRYSVGDQIFLTNGLGDRAKGEIAEIGKKVIQTRILEVQKFDKPNNLGLALGLLHNKSRLEFAIEKAVELGVTHIYLFAGNHSEFKKVNVERMESYVVSAMKQSLGTWLPEVRVFSSFEECVEKSASGFQRRILFHEKVEGNPFVLSRNETSQGLCLFVGPEGGFSELELEIGKENNLEIKSLGSRRLRSETAALTALARVI